MDKNIIDKLHTLKQATSPDAEFAAHTRRLLFAIQPIPHRFPTWVFAVTAAVILVAVSGLLLPSSPTISSSLDAKFLQEEFNDLNINIQLQEITYRQDINETISSALDEVSGTHISHLNPDILKSEEKLIDELQLENDGPRIDIMLDQIIF